MGLLNLPVLVIRIFCLQSMTDAADPQITSLTPEPTVVGTEGVSSPLKLLIATDAWDPQTNGVVTTLKSLIGEMERQGHTIKVITPELFNTIATNYPDLSLAVPWGMSGLIESFQPNGIFIATEGPVGFACRHFCVKHNLPFTSAYTTRWPEYFDTHLKFPPIPLGYQYLKWFHEPATGLMVSTRSLLKELRRKGFKNLAQWTRGVDTDRFKPMALEQKQAFLPEHPRPFFVNIGRVSKEKNLQAFLELDLPGTQIVVGPGPDLDELREAYPKALFVGPKHGQALYDYYAGSDVFVFPSKSDTFGLVMLEALASGIPVAAYNVTGPKDVIEAESAIGFLAEEQESLGAKVLEAWQAVQSGTVTAEDCRNYGLRYSWEQGVHQLLGRMKFIQWAGETPRPRMAEAP